MNAHGRPSHFTQPGSNRLLVVRLDRDKNFVRNRRRWSVCDVINRLLFDLLAPCRGARIRRRKLRVDLLKQTGHQDLFICTIDAIDHPSSRATNTTTTNEENVNSSIEFISNKREDISVCTIIEDNNVLFQNVLNRFQVIAGLRGSFKVEVRCGFFHPFFQLTDNGTGLPLHEIAVILRKLTMIFFANRTDTGSGTFVDMCQKTGSLLSFRTLKNTRGARTHGVDT